MLNLLLTLTQYEIITIHHNNTFVDIYILHVKLYILTQLPACLILSFFEKYSLL